MYAVRLNHSCDSTLLVNVNDTAIKKLNKRKGDGNHGYYSDHIILSTNKFKTIIVILINCMLIPAHNPEDLLASVIASIPKNLRSSLNTSDNYRANHFVAHYAK